MQLQIYDLIMLLVLAGAVAFGAWKGLAWQLASLTAIGLSYVVAYQFRGPVSQYINAKPPWNIFLAMFLLYIATSLVVWVAFGFIRDIIDKVKLKDFDRHTGAMLGAVKGAILCIIVTLFAVTLLDDVHKKQVCSSYSGNIIAKAIDRIDVAMPTEVHDVLHPYLHTLDANLEHDHTAHAEAEHSNAATDPQPLEKAAAQQAARKLIEAAGERFQTNR